MYLIRQIMKYLTFYHKQQNQEYCKFREVQLPQKKKPINDFVIISLIRPKLIKLKMD